MPTDDMLRTFNCGLGMVVVVAPSDAAAVAKALTDAGESVCDVGADRDARRAAKPIAWSTTPRAYGEAEGRHPDLGPRQQHGGADRGRPGGRLPG